MPGVTKLLTRPDGSVYLNNPKATFSGGVIKPQTVETGMKLSTGSLTLGLSNVFGTPVNLVPPAGFNAMILNAIEAVAGGTFAGGGENVSLKIVATFIDGSTTTFTPAAYTGTGMTDYAVKDFLAELKDNNNIVSLAISAKTDQSSTTATLTVTVAGEYSV